MFQDVTLLWTSIGHYFSALELQLFSEISNVVRKSSRILSEGKFSGKNQNLRRKKLLKAMVKVLIVVFH